MTFCDFVVRYDPAKETPADLTKKILYSLIILRLKAHKPAVCFVAGESGEGKSFSTISLEDALLDMQGIDLLTVFNDVNVYTPLEYPQKLDALLFDKRLKKVNVITMHEAREVVKAKNWRSFLTTSISDINAMSRSVKRLAIFIISQFIRDVTTDIRYTMNFYIKAVRPRGKPARLYISKMWKDDSDLEKPKLRKRRIMGFIVLPNGKYQKYMPKYLELKKPRKELIDIFEKADYDAKVGIIKKKINRLMAEMKEDIGEQSNKIKAMVEWYVTNNQNIGLIAKRTKRGIITTAEFKEMHDLTDIEVKQFQKQLAEALQQHNLAPPPETQEEEKEGIA